VVAKDASGRRARTISNKFGIIRVDEATGMGGATADADLGTLASPNQPTFYDYNIKGELVKITQPNFAKGALTKTSSSISENLYTEFDNFGRLKKSQQVTDGTTYEFLYKYNLSGALVEETYPSGRIVRNFLDSDGGLAQIVLHFGSMNNKIQLFNKK
jgi:hypothetical protein